MKRFKIYSSTINTGLDEISNAFKAELKLFWSLYPAKLPADIYTHYGRRIYMLHNLL